MSFINDINAKSEHKSNSTKGKKKRKENDFLVGTQSSYAKCIRIENNKKTKQNKQMQK